MIRCSSLKDAEAKKAKKPKAIPLCNFKAPNGLKCRRVLNHAGAHHV